jgi:hypothetical protein
MNILNFINKLESQYPTDYKTLILPDKDSTKFKIVIRRTYERPLIITPDENEYQKTLNAKQRYRRRWYLENKKSSKTNQKHIIK